MADIQLTGVCKAYGKKSRAADDLTLHIASGEFLVVVGPSGCGKSTLLRLIAGLEKPDSGELFLNGKNAAGIEPKDRSAAMVFQDYSLYPNLTAYDNMALALKQRRLPKAKIDERIREAASLLGILPLLDRRPRALSGGQKQRVAIGRAIVRKPDILLMDEPFSNLDAGLRTVLCTEMRQLQKALGTTLVYVTHDRKEALSAGSRVAVMAEGRIRQVGTPDELYRCPLDRFVAGFLGDAKMNFLGGRLSRSGEILRLSVGGSDISLPAVLAARCSLPDGEAAVTVGLRPEELTTGKLPDALTLSFRAAEIDRLGSETDVSGELPESGETLRLILPGNVPLTEGGICDVSLPVEKLCLFDAESGRSLLLP